MEFYVAVKKDDIMSFAGKWIELEAIILSEVTQSQKEKKKGKWFPLFVDANAKSPVGWQTEQLYYYISLYLKQLCYSNVNL